MAKLRICSPQLGISPESNLGGEVHDREMLKALADLGIQVDIILPLGKKHESHDNWHFHYLPIPAVSPPIIFNLLIIPHLFWIYYRYRFNVLRIHSPYFVGPGAIFFRQFFPRVKLIATYHHIIESHNLYNLIDRVLIPRFDLITAVSTATSEQITTRNQVPKANILVIPNGVDKKYHPQPKNRELLNKFSLQSKIVLLYLGQITNRKNISFLVDLMTVLPHDFHLIICGRGELLPKIKDQITNKKLNNQITLTGLVPEKEKVDYYNLADIFVYPSLLEGFGLSVLEAMACGKPVITSQNASFKEIINDKKSGYLCPLQTSHWKKVILTLNSPKIYSAVSREAEKQAQKFTWSASAHKYLNALKSL